MSIQGRRYLPALLIGLTLAVGIVIGSLMSRGVRAARPFALAPDATPLGDPSPIELSNSFSKVAANVEPAVVSIYTDTTIHVSGNPHSPDGSPLGDFFDKYFQFGPPDGRSNEFRQQSLGSGVILDKNGYILTNYHVITQDGEDRPVDRMRVHLHGDDNPKGYDAKIVGTDKWTDLAVIKINVGHPLPAAEVGDSHSMRVGDWVLAIGSPFELDSTVTAGIISAKGREIEGGTQGQFKKFIQTDAAINPGNSGGPLVNMGGQVIGINTAIATTHGVYDGIGFAIPSNTARKVYNSIIATGSVRRGAIGVSFINENNPALLRSFGADHGVVVNGIEAGSPADQAGLKMGDVITAVNGKPVMSGDDLVSIVSDSEIGAKLKVDFLRNRQAMSAEVRVGDRNQVIGGLNSDPQSDKDSNAQPQTGGVLGLSVRSLPADQALEIASQLRLGSPQGVLVTDAKPEAFASDTGIDRGDVILSINHQPIHSLDDFNRLQASLKSGQDVLFLIARRAGPHSYESTFLADRLP